MSTDDSPIPNFSLGTNGLLPAIAQDATTNRVLMMAWMNAQAWEETLKSGYAVYFSRSRNQLWRKGETSGHQQRVVEIRVDCDADTILMKVEQKGAACHEGFESCFFRTVREDGTVAVADERLVDPQAVYGKKPS
ncbi:phosphoribosyl-AMP cyclohydrolase [Novipirellula sp. SH528]|uniref:phosphoribosyl-AMP cyclohydrolase n=1 Tax=Novipirellula sp. SH528 TaxID=3454466 RepID=UPI003FA0B741